MPIITQDELPVIYEDWAEWRIEKGTAQNAQGLIEPDHVFCVICWGQRRIYEAAANGEGYVPRPCVDCAGRGTTSPAGSRREADI